ncbi:hypothetical protein [Xanthomarina gelatinilytica]|uniref:hypothetical protein n=1 Tax=Xanthomarina gelatinilytica TaxID=1137281 RepID=UPI003AA86644
MKILSLFVFTAIISCESKTTFTHLPKHSSMGIYDRDGEHKGKKYVYRSVLVDNPPKDKAELEKLLSSYHLENRDSIFSDPEMSTFLTWFYQKNYTTSYFISKADDPGGFSSEILSDYYEKFGIAEIVTKRIGKTNELKTEVTFTNSP